MVPRVAPHRPPTILTWWGVLGVMALLSSGVWRVFPHALEPVVASTRMSTFHWTLYVGCIVFNAYTEGYKAFQRVITPRVLARAQWLTDNPGRVHPLVAPVFVGGFFGMQRRALIVRYVVLLVIVAVIVGMKFVPQPWRGIIDAGVVVGLGWGVVAMGVGLVRMARGWMPDADPQLPDSWLTEDARARRAAASQEMGDEDKT